MSTATAIDPVLTGADTTSSIERYLAEIDDPVLRENLSREIGGLQRQFGLVFERHHPEGIRLPKHKVKRGSKVVISSRNGKAVKDSPFYRVQRLHRDESTALIVDVQGNEQIIPIDELTVAKEFGDIMYPGLRRLSEVRRGAIEAPVHTIINGENYHALEALQYTHAGRVDVIYIDPPYNTGNADWKYNDRYVDAKDGYRHSKWLSFMEKRLTIARQLLTEHGTILLAIDDNEHSRLKVLCDQIFGEGNFIANVVWNGGRKNDSRFVSSGHDYMLIYGKNVEALKSTDVRWREPKPGVDEVLEAGAEAWSDALFEAYCGQVDGARELYASASGLDNPDARLVWAEEGIRSKLDGADEFRVRQRASEIATARLKAWWKALPKDHPAHASKHYNHVCGHSGKVFFPDNISWPGGGGPRYDVLHPLTGKPVPIPSRGWVFGSPERMQEMIELGRIHFGPNENRGINAKSYLAEVDSAVPSSVFDRDRRASAKYLAGVLGSKEFPFPKDVDVIARWVRIASAGNPDAIVLDFFGGTGTTAEAVIRLNAMDGGRRQAILVTNNELAKADDTRLRKAGHLPGDEAYEALGVFHHVTRPRLETVVTGVRQDGSKFSDGLDANIAFFELEYLEEPEIVTGRAFNDLAGLFWLKAGGVGGPVELTPGARSDGFVVSESGRTAVLFTAGRAQALAEKLAVSDSEIGHLFIVTDSAAQGDEAASHFPAGITVERIYGSYLEAFQVNRKD